MTWKHKAAIKRNEARTDPPKKNKKPQLLPINTLQNPSENPFHTSKDNQSRPEIHDSEIKNKLFFTYSVTKFVEHWLHDNCYVKC